MLEYVYNDRLKGGLVGAQRWHKSRQPNHFLNPGPGQNGLTVSSGSPGCASQLYPQVHALLTPQIHHLLFPLGAAHTRDLLVEELDGVVHAC